ncbi:MAG: acyl carrier protein [Bacteroidota bacterium]
MNLTDQQSIIKLIKKHLHRVAPEADLTQLDPNAELGSTLDIDSMDFYTMVVALSEEVNVDIPEEEYGKLRSLNSIAAFLEKQQQK